MFSWIYGKITDVRNALYDREIFKSFAVGAPVISIGNLTVGGTGKTPLVAFAAEVLAGSGAKVGILTRGYGRENQKERVLVSDGEKMLANARQSGDEPFELAQKLLGKALVVADANRTEAAKWALEKFGATVFVLDDAFQHRRLKRDLDIVAIDATNPFGNGKTLPFGILREPLKNLARADLVIITRANLIDEKQLSGLKLQITHLNPKAPVFTAENKISNLIELESFNSTKQSKTQTPEPGTWNLELGTQTALAFCALGNPENFFEQLRREKFELAATRAFPDHHRYTQSDVNKLETEAKKAGAECFLTTAKDAVKLAKLKFGLPGFVVENTLVFDNEKKLREIINAVLIQNPKSKIQTR